jgi:putative transcriptional regulator
VTPRLHPEEDLLIGFAAGSLGFGPNLVVGAHVRACPMCARVVALGEALGGVLLDGLTPIPMVGDALDRALAAIERPCPPVSAFESPRDWITVPREVVLAAGRSRRWVVPGAWVTPLRRGPGRSRTYLLGMRPGLGVLRHRHEGAEMTLVLKGALVDGDEVAHPGDFMCAGTDLRHGPKVHGEEECICLVAAEGPMVALDWVGRVMSLVAGV